jgi:hypothetical protein
MKSFLIRIFILLFVFALNIESKGQSVPRFAPLSPKSRVTVLTCDPGTQMYARFGHSAIAIHDSLSGLHIVFNYGTFSFHTPGFYRKFLAGKLNYKLGMQRFDRFQREYIREGRKVIEEELNLTAIQKQAVFDYLMNNYKPENRYYQYDFLFDNCATRITDVLEATLNDSLEYIGEKQGQAATFRNLLNTLQQGSPWSKWGIAFVLGSVIDREATPREKTFLPEYLHHYIQQCTVNGKPLVKKSEELVPSTEAIPNTPWYLGPVFLFWMLFVVVAILSYKYKHLPFIVFDRVLLITFGLLGLIVFLMWFATDHDAAAGNLNLIWANPLYLVLAFFIKSNMKIKMVKPAIQVFMLFCSLTIFGWYWLPQDFNGANIPLIAMLILRFLFIHLNISKMEPKVV